MTKPKKVEHRCPNSSCKAIFKCRQHLYRHSLSCSRLTSCDCVCVKSFARKDHLERHKLKKIGSYCSKPFTQPYDIRQHLLVHMKDDGYKCSSCGKSYVHKRYYKSHMFTCKEQITNLKMRKLIVVWSEVME